MGYREGWPVFTVKEIKERLADVPDDVEVTMYADTFQEITIRIGQEVVFDAFDEEMKDRRKPNGY